MSTEEQLQRWDEFTPMEGIGTAIRNLEEASSDSLKLLRATYDFDELGGAEGDIILLDDDGEEAVIPANAIVKRAYIDVLVDPTAVGAATVGIGVEAAEDILADTAIASITGLMEGEPDGAVANMFKTSEAQNVVATIATDDLTAGKFHVFIEYMLSEAAPAP